MSNKYLITIVGPTAIGKTALAIKIAQHYKCEILSCDSRQFYREMNIGTAVPSRDELAAVTHHFIHHISVTEKYSVGDFEKDALVKLEELFLTNDYAVLVGGSGLYVDAVLDGLDAFPEISENIREHVRKEYLAKGISYLQQTLRQVDIEYYRKVDTENPQRMMRALEVSLSSDQPYSSFLKKENNKRVFKPILIGLEMEREKLYEQINHRVDVMVGSGLVAEAQKLFGQRELNALQTVGYRELFAFFADDFTLAFAISEIKKNTRRFAKRQMTWFKRNTEIHWFDRSENVTSIFDYIEQQVEKNN